MDPCAWYAYRLKKAFKGWGTDDRTMCRILGCADKKDALKIAEAWQREPNPNPIRTRTRPTRFEHYRIVLTILGCVRMRLGT